MKSQGKLLTLIACSLFAVSLVLPQTEQAFEWIKISDRLNVLTDTQYGGAQLALSTEKGVVVFDSHWSTITAARFKTAISERFAGQKIAYVLNTVDRLDIFGGNAVYRDSVIIGHDSFASKFTEASASAQIKELIAMWRWKGGVSRERLETHEPGSKQEASERAWMNTCKRRADELEQGFELLLPTLRYRDRLTLDMGDVTLELIYFGRAGYEGMTIVVIPEEQLAIIPGFIMHPQHLAPHPHAEYTVLDVPRWIAVLEDILDEQSGIDRVVVDTRYQWSKERARTHLRYIKEIWKTTQEAAKNGLDLQAVQELCSLEEEFAFVKDIQVYKDHGDDWIRPQHEAHTKVFFLQHGHEEPAREHQHGEPACEHQHHHEVDPEHAAELAQINKEYDEAWAAWQERFVTSGEFAPGMTVADLGAGKGELTVLLARRVGRQGQVFANEIEAEKLSEIRKLCEREGLTNVTTILGGESDPRLPSGQTDVAVMVEVFHHLTDRAGFLKAVRSQLKPGGKMIIVEANAKTAEQLEACHTDPHQSRELAEQAGFAFQRLDSFMVRKTEFFALVLQVPDSAG